MLQNLGDKLKRHKWLGYLVLGPLALIFAAWGAYGVVNTSFGSSSYGLKVNDQEFSVATIQNSWQQRLAQIQAQQKTDIPAVERTLLQQQLIDQYVRTAVMQQRAKDFGFRVSNAELLDAMRKESAFQVDGQFDAAAYRTALAQAGLSVTTYETDLRAGLAVDQLTEGLQLGNFLTNAEVAQIFALENEQREVRFALLPLARFEAGVNPDEAQIKAWYEAHASDYLTTESVRLQYADLKLDSVAATVPIDSADLQSWYDKNQSRYSEVEQRHAHHILIKVAANADAKTDAAALTKAQDLLAQIRKGADFADVAKKNSDDSGSAAQGGDLGFADASAYVKPFADALFKLKPGELSEPVRTEYGYHIIRLDELHPAHAKTLADSRAEIEADYRRDRAADTFGDRQEQIQQKLEAGTTGDLAGLAKDFGLTVGEVTEFTRTDGGALGTNADLNRVVFSTDMLAGGRVGGPVALADDHLVLVKVLEHHEPAPKPLASVRSDIIAAIRKDTGTRLARAAADNALKQLDSGASFDTVVKSLGVNAPAASFVARTDPQLPAQVRDAAFAVAPPAAGKPAFRVVPLEEGGAAVLAVSAVRPGTPGTNPTSDQKLISEYARRDREALLEAYVQDLQQHAKIQTNSSIFQ
jgi:peptidyl-prolyl cis-trans isomerase D